MDNQDYTRQLFCLLAEGRTRDFTRRGEEALKQIAEDISDLQMQDRLIRKAIERHGSPATALRITRPPNTPTDFAQREAIREIAIELAKEDPSREVHVQSVAKRLEKRGMGLMVAKPNSVVGSIVRRTKGFTKIGGGKYRYAEIP